MSSIYFYNIPLNPYMKKILLILLFILPFTLAAQTKCSCEDHFAWVKKTFEENDAGFQYSLQQKGKAVYEKHNITILEKIRAAKNINDCTEIITEWLKFFRKSHFSVSAINQKSPTISPVDKPAIWPTYSITEEEFKQYLSKIPNPGLEGIWYTAPYTIGIIKKNNAYIGFILAAPGTNWKTNQVKVEINPTKNGNFEGTMYIRDYSPIVFKETKFLGNNGLQLGYFNLKRLYPQLQESKEMALYSELATATNPFLKELSDSTILLRIPSFDDAFKKTIDSILSANHKLLTHRKNLIIDIRNNGGGSDVSYQKIIPYLYTNPYRITGLEFLSTPLNNKRMEGYLSIPNLSERSKKGVNEALSKLKANLGNFINLNDSTMFTQRLDSVYSYPKNVAIVTNQNNGSTAEEFLLMAKQSKKVKLYGKTTMGVLDISNMYFVESPCKEIQLGYCLSKSLRIPEMAIDNIGIQPDYYIDKSIPDERWIAFIENILNQK